MILTGSHYKVFPGQPQWVCWSRSHIQVGATDGGGSGKPQAKASDHRTQSFLGQFSLSLFLSNLTWWLLQLPSADLYLEWKQRSEQSASRLSASHPDKLPGDDCDDSDDHGHFLVGITYELKVCRWYKVAHWEGWEVVFPALPHLGTGECRWSEVPSGDGRWMQVIQGSNRWFYLVTGDFRWYQLITGDYRWSSMWLQVAKQVITGGLTTFASTSSSVLW